MNDSKSCMRPGAYCLPRDAVDTRPLPEPVCSVPPLKAYDSPDPWWVMWILGPLVTGACAALSHFFPMGIL